jgi:hypothetical protein
MGLHPSRPALIWRWVVLIDFSPDPVAAKAVCKITNSRSVLIRVM